MARKRKRKRKRKRRSTMDQQGKEANEGIKEVNEGTPVDAATLEDAVEKAQEASEVDYDSLAELLGLVKFYGRVMEESVNHATFMLNGLRDRHPEMADYPNTTEVAVALFHKVTAGEERRELVGLFERAIKWYTDTQDKQAADVEASRDRMLSSIRVEPAPAPDPMFRGLRSIVTCLLDIIQDAAKPKAAEAGLNTGMAVREEIGKQTGQEDQNPSGMPACVDIWESFSPEERAVIRQRDKELESEWQEAQIAPAVREEIRKQTGQEVQE
jgi:hypothetical protein